MHINKQARCKWARFQFGYCNIKNKLKRSKKRTDKSKSKQQSNRITSWNVHPNNWYLQTQCTYWCFCFCVELAQHCTITSTLRQNQRWFQILICSILFPDCFYFFSQIWLDSVVPENTGLVTVSWRCLCSAAVDAELAKDIQLWHKTKSCKGVQLSEQQLATHALTSQRN